MIRKKKKDTNEIITPLSEDENNEGQMSENKEDKKKKKAKKFPWKNKKDKIISEKNETETTEEKEEGFDPLNLEQEGAEYLKTDDTKKISVKKIALFAGIAIVLIAGIVFFVVKNMNSGESGKVYVQSVGVITGLGTANGGSNRYTGVVEPQDSWKITLDAEMSVSECYVKVGDEVKKGDKLFSYNTEELKLNKEKKELEISTMENEINQLTKDIKSYESDLKGASSSEKIELQTQILTAQTTIKKNQFSIKNSKEEIKKIEKTIKDATVKSKMDGVVKSINSSLGNSSNDDESSNLMSSDNGEDSNAYMIILATGDYRVKGTVKETNAPAFSEGEAVIIRSRTEDKTWQGNVQALKTDATADSTSTNSDYIDDSSSMESASNYNFYVTLKDDEGLMMGQHVFIEPDNGQDGERDGMWVSSAYIVVEDDAYYVWADNGHERLEKRNVEIGQYDETLDEYQVLSGIALEDYIACDDIDLKDGMKTTKVDPYSEDESLEDESGDDIEDSDQDYEEDFDESLDDGISDSLEDEAIEQ